MRNRIIVYCSFNHISPFSPWNIEGLKTRTIKINVRCFLLGFLCGLTYQNVKHVLVRVRDEGLLAQKVSLNIEQPGKVNQSREYFRALYFVSCISVLH